MSSKLTFPSLITILIAIIMYWTNVALAQSSCTNELMGLSPCLNYVTGNATAPSSSCCTQLAGVVNSQPRCLCLLLNGGASSVGITINQTRALALPDDCKVQTPPVSRCNSPNGETPSANSPEGSPAGSSNETPSISDAPAGGGSKTVPSTVDSSVGVRSSTKLLPLFQLIIGFLLFIASTTSSC
ncbi:hypothetical protein M9H77_01471 [Catharanthus roseus]|uniref:Uncharacterized protein n=1 Tax=Catharanthus roseus TaxID=4058 RepID=A0ACC0C5R6_CATRO|nr:hypothetical protein M9H77_01471 [Catharanthus roseus]